MPMALMGRDMTTEAFQEALAERMNLLRSIPTAPYRRRDCGSIFHVAGIPGSGKTRYVMEHVTELKRHLEEMPDVKRSSNVSLSLLHRLLHQDRWTQV